MKITIENYGEAIKEIGIDNVPEEWREFADALREDTDNYSDWSEYHNVPDIKEMADFYFKELEKLYKGKEHKASKESSNVKQEGSKRKEFHFKVTKDNYFSVASRLEIPDEWRSEHEYIKGLTEHGVTWEGYSKSKAAQDRIRKYFNELESFIQKIPGVINLGSKEDNEVYDNDTLLKLYTDSIYEEFESTPTIVGLVHREIIAEIIKERTGNDILKLVEENPNLAAAGEETKEYANLSVNQLKDRLREQEKLEAEYGLAPDTEIRMNALRKEIHEKEHSKGKSESKNSKPKAVSVSKDDKYEIGQDVILKATGEEAIINKIFTIRTGHFIPGKGATEPEVEYSFMVKTKDAIKPVNEDEIKVIPKPKAEAKSRKEERESEVIDNTKFVENIAEDVKFIKSFVGLHNKEKSFSSLRGLLNRLQKAILQRIIRKESPFASEIKTVQDKLVKLVNSLRENQSVKVIIDKSLLNKLVLISGGEKVYTSIGYIKRYIGMQGKQIEREKALAFATQMEKAIKNGKLTNEDPYLDKIKSIVKSLNNYLIGKETVVSISKAELNGLMGIVEGCGCGLSGIEDISITTDKVDTTPSSGIMNSMDFLKLNFEGLGFVGKWYELIGNPAKGFSAMVFGKPKFGKSYLCIDWAGYVSINHGKTLYVAQEEALDKTLKMKVEERGVANPNLDLSDHLPDDLSKYSFVFIDSVTKLGLTPDDLTKLEKKNPDTSFIYIFQVRKDGAFRGRNDFQHNVDIVIEVPQKGLAVQYGRYNQGGEMQIFDEDEFRGAA